MAKYKVRVKSTDRQIIDQIYKVVANELNGRLYDVWRDIVKDIRQVFKDAIERDPVWESLKNGELQAHLGLYPHDVKPDEILNIWLNSIDAKFSKFKKRGNTYKAGLAVTLIEEDFTDVLSSPAAIYISATKSDLSGGYLIPWLRWLLIEGDRIIVRNYDINLKLISGGQVAASRSGKALMYVKRGAGYRLPPQYTGTINNNFVKDALNRLDPVLYNIINDAVDRVI